MKENIRGNVRINARKIQNKKGENCSNCFQKATRIVTIKVVEEKESMKVCDHDICFLFAIHQISDVLGRKLDPWDP